VAIFSAEDLFIHKELSLEKTVNLTESEYPAISASATVGISESLPLASNKNGESSRQNYIRESISNQNYAKEINIATQKNEVIIKI
jgi:hypothetical protein